MVTEKYTETKNFITKSTPTDKTESTSDYGSGRQKVLCDEEYATKDVTMERTTRITLLVQEIVNEAEFDLPIVIGAINKLGGTRGA